MWRLPVRSCKSRLRESGYEQSGEVRHVGQEVRNPSCGRSARSARGERAPVDERARVGRVEARPGSEQRAQWAHPHARRSTWCCRAAWPSRATGRRSSLPDERPAAGNGVDLGFDREPVGIERKQTWLRPATRCSTPSRQECGRRDPSVLHNEGDASQDAATPWGRIGHALQSVLSRLDVAELAVTRRRRLHGSQGQSLPTLRRRCPGARRRRTLSVERCCR